MLALTQMSAADRSGVYVVLSSYLMGVTADAAGGRWFRDLACASL